MNGFGGDFWGGSAAWLSEALWRASWHALWIVPVVAGIEWCCPRLPAAWRSWLWRLTMLKLVVSLGVGVAIPLPVLAPKTADLKPVAISKTTKLTASPSTDSIVAADVSGSSKARFAGTDLRLPLLLAWSMAAGILAIRLWRNRQRAKRLLARSAPCRHPFLLTLCGAEQRSFGVQRRLPVRLIPGEGSPLLLATPALVLPEGWLSSCSLAQLRLAVAHELAHLVRRDLAWNRLAALCQTLLFFHPLVWFALVRYRATQELACDDLALRRTGEPAAELGRMLLRLAMLPSAHSSFGGAAVSVMNSPSTLRERMVAMSRSGQQTRVSLASAISVAALMLLVLTPWSLAEQSKSTGGTQTKPTPRQKVRSPGERAAVPRKNSQTLKNGSISAAASASGSASGFAGGVGNGSANGQGGAFAGGQASARSKVAISTGDDDDDAEEVPEQSANRPKKSAPSAKRSSRSKSVTATVTDDGNGKRKTVTSTDDKQRVTITESPAGIKLSIKSLADDKETLVEAKDARELKKNHPEAYALYKELTAQPNAAANGAFPGDAPAGNPAKELLREQLENLQGEQPDNSQLKSLLGDALNSLDAEE